MDVGDDARKAQEKATGPQKYDAIALGIAAAIRSRRPEKKKTAYLVHSLKHPHEVRTLRNLYQRGFYLIGIHAPAETRRSYLINSRNLTKKQAEKLMGRDRQEKDDYGQKLVDTFHLADVFFGLSDGKDKIEQERYVKFVKNNIGRFIEIVFGHPNRTPTFGEYAMFLAFSASLRSADLSRQVGAVITRKGEILGAGANDCPKAHGGLYWPTLNTNTLQFEDTPNGRDFTRGKDSNRDELVQIGNRVLIDAKAAFAKILSQISDLSEEDQKQTLNSLTTGLHGVLEDSPIRDLTEFGRVVHAEMEALLSCARKGIATIGSTLFSTTFPCHNCAKHIIAAGVRRVVFIQPYLKSKSLDMYEDDSIEITYAQPLEKDDKEHYDKVRFEPFVGVGPRRFLDLFSMDLGIGWEMDRKEADGSAIKWSPDNARVRITMTRDSYLERELQAVSEFNSIVELVAKADTPQTE